MFKFRSGMHGLNKELDRHRGREGKVECSLCGAECVHVLSRDCWLGWSHHIFIMYRGNF